MSDENLLLLGTYDFLPNFKLHAYLQIKNGDRPLLRVTHHDAYGYIRGTLDIACIHAILAQLSPDEYNQIKSDPDANIKFQAFVSSEGRLEGHLERDDRIFVHKSWTEGIAKAGMEALKLTDDTYTEGGKELHTMYDSRAVSIIQQIFRFVASKDITVVYDYINYIERECLFAGKRHVPSYVANIKILLDGVDYQVKEKIVEYIISSDPPMELIADIGSSTLLKHPNLVATHGFDQLLDNFDRMDLRDDMKRVVVESSLEKPAFLRFFDSTDRIVLETLSTMSTIHEFPDAIKLFSSSHPFVLRHLASNAEMCRFPEFATLFASKDRETMQNLAQNPKAVKFPEYRQLFQSDNLDVIVDVARNIASAKAYPSEFRALFSHPSDRVKEQLASNYDLVDMFPKEYDQFFLCLDHHVRYSFLNNPKSVKCPLFADYLKESDHRSELLNLLLYKNDADTCLRNYTIFTPEDFRPLILEESNHWLLKSISTSETLAEKLDCFGKLFSWKGDHLHQLFANPKAVSLPEYSQALTQKNYEQYHLEIDANAKDLPAYRELVKKIKDDEKDLIAQIESGKIDFKQRNISFFHHKSVAIRVAVAKSKSATESGGFYTLCTDRSSAVKEACASNPDAVSSSGFYRLYRARKISIQMALLRNPNIVTRGDKIEVRRIIESLGEKNRNIAKTFPHLAEFFPILSQPSK